MKKRKKALRKLVDPFGPIENCEPPRFLSHACRLEWFRVLNLVPSISKADPLLSPLLCAWVFATESIAKITKTKRAMITKSMRTFKIYQACKDEVVHRTMVFNRDIEDALFVQAAIQTRLGIPPDANLLPAWNPR